MRDSLTKKTKVEKDRSTMFCEGTVSFFFKMYGYSGTVSICQKLKGFHCTSCTYQILSLEAIILVRVIMMSWGWISPRSVLLHTTKANLHKPQCSEPRVPKIYQVIQTCSSGKRIFQYLFLIMAHFKVHFRAKDMYDWQWERTTSLPA